MKAKTFKMKGREIKSFRGIIDWGHKIRKYIGISLYFLYTLFAKGKYSKIRVNYFT